MSALVHYFDPFIVDSVVIATLILLGFAWLLRSGFLIARLTARGANGPRKWLPLAGLIALVLFFSTAMFSARNTLRLVRILVPVALLPVSMSLNDIGRRTAHLVEYGVLFLAAVSGPLRGRRGLAIALCTLVALVDEGHQAMLPERSGLASDVAFDILGAFVANLADLIVMTTRV